MIDIEDKSKCCGCHGCYNICPQNAIEMIPDEKGFWYPKVDKEKCINCGLCDKICPILNKTEIKNEPQVFAAYNKDEKTRKESSSGGVFTLLAEKILEKNGVVFGARFDGDFNVIHDFVEKKEDLEVFRGSKYVQSKIGDTYRKAEGFLKDNRPVLFTGTPCQIEGLKTFLRKDYENLYTQDLICHGVPSPKVWRKYLDFREKRDASHPVRINFRQKDNGWNLYALLLQYNNNNNVYKTNHHDDLFMQTFLQNVCLRESCYDCSFKSKHRKSDITLADFWGIDQILPEMNDDKGTSLVIINSEKGQKLFEKVQENLVVKEVDFETSIQFNQSMFKSENPHKNRNKFFQNLDKLEFDKLVKKCIPKRSLLRRFLSKAKKIIKSFIK